ncbi:ATP-dependent RNA helicase WM6-like [Drosophila tropicalis]|uniref:ATP-dependent RNA helicase WM6-like n=1 Tax=Drosophila tropicalis TaxID=46794 RepID=UPI0035AB9E88
MNNTGYPKIQLKPEILRVLTENQFDVHQECFSQVVHGADVLYQTTSDVLKTTVFVLATLQQLDLVEDNSISCRSLVMCNSSDMAKQIAKKYERFAKYMPGVSIGLAIEKDESFIPESPQIVIGTPICILELFRKNIVNISQLRHLMMDECDDMFEQVTKRRAVLEIFRNSPHKKQVVMFLSELSKNMKNTCRKLMHENFEVFVDHASQLCLQGWQQHSDHVEESEKSKRLFYLLEILEFNQVVIFVETVPQCLTLVQQLINLNFPAVALHGQLERNELLHNFHKFRDYYKRILVTNITFGKGIDIKGVNIIFIYQMPKDPIIYLHRAARAGRFGAKGLGITFISNENDVKLLNDVQCRFKFRISQLPEIIDLSSYIEGR